MLSRFAAAIDAHRARGPLRVLELPGGPPPPQWWRGELGDVGAVLLLAAAGVAPADAVPGTHLVTQLGRHVAIGVLPAEAGAGTIAAVQGRCDKHAEAGPVALLGSREERARQLLDKVEVALRGRPSLAVARLSAERLRRYELPGVLAQGPGLALYVGRGRRLGWAGYGGVEAWQLDLPGAKPLGAVLSLTCQASARSGPSPSFSEELVVRGRAAAALGAIEQTLHSHNRSLAIAIADRLAGGAATLADLLPAGHPALAGYRICGDPLAPLVGAGDHETGIPKWAQPSPSARGSTGCLRPAHSQYPRRRSRASSQTTSG